MSQFSPVLLLHIPYLWEWAFNLSGAGKVFSAILQLCIYFRVLYKYSSKSLCLREMVEHVLQEVTQSLIAGLLPFIPQLIHGAGNQVALAPELQNCSSSQGSSACIFVFMTKLCHCVPPFAFPLHPSSGKPPCGSAYRNSQDMGQKLEARWAQALLRSRRPKNYPDKAALWLFQK